MTTTLPLATSSWGAEEIAALHAVIDSGMHTMGPRVREFEAAAAELHGVRHCVMVNSGSSANLLMVAALFHTEDPSRRLRRGDVVVVPAVSWSTTYAPLQQYGLRLRFVDVDPATFNVTAEGLARALDDDVRAVMVVNLLGNPAPARQIRDLVAGRDVVLLEDNCESLGARSGTGPTGTLGLLSSCSSFFSHHISTMEGGFVLTDDDELDQLLRSLRAHGWTRDLDPGGALGGLIDDDPFMARFQFVLPGYNLRPLEMAGAVGVVQLRRLPGFVAQRRANATHLRELLGSSPAASLQQETGASSWFGFGFVASSPAARADLVRRLGAAGVDTRPIVTGDFTRQAALRWYDHEVVGRLDGAGALHERGFFVGNHQIPLDDPLAEVASIISAPAGGA